jgi:protein-disulfide isomerase
MKEGDSMIKRPYLTSCLLLVGLLLGTAQKEEIERDMAYGRSVGVRGTPHYFIGRIEGDKLVDVKRVSGAQSFQAFADLIDPLLQ